MPFGGLFGTNKSASPTPEPKDLNTKVREGLEAVQKSFGSVFAAKLADSNGVIKKITAETGLAFLESLRQKMKEIEGGQWTQIDEVVNAAKRTHQKVTEKGKQDLQQKAVKILLGATGLADFKMMGEIEEVAPTLYHIHDALKNGTAEEKATAIYYFYRLLQALVDTDKQEKTADRGVSTFLGTVTQLHPVFVTFLLTKGPVLEAQLRQMEQKGGLIDSLIVLGEALKISKLEPDAIRKQLGITDMADYKRALDMVSHLVERNFVELDETRKAKVMSAIELLRPALEERSQPRL